MSKKTPEKEYDLDLSWMDQNGEWGTRAEPGRNGLTLADIQIGTYGAVSYTHLTLPTSDLV